MRFHKRFLQRALRELRERGVEEAYLRLFCPEKTEKRQNEGKERGRETRAFLVSLLPTSADKSVVTFRTLFFFFFAHQKKKKRLPSRNGGKNSVSAAPRPARAFHSSVRPPSKARPPPCPRADDGPAWPQPARQQQQQHPRPLPLRGRSSPSETSAPFRSSSTGPERRAWSA